MLDGVALVIDDRAAAADPAGIAVREDELAAEELEVAFVVALGGQAGLYASGQSLGCSIRDGLEAGVERDEQRP